VKGLGMWIMSKVVMLIFLFVTFGVVFSFMSIGQEQSRNQAAEALASDLVNTISNTLSSNLEEATLNFPLPRRIPEKSYRLNLEKGEPYTLVIGLEGAGTYKRLYAAVAMLSYPREGEHKPETYISSAYALIPSGYSLESCNYGEEIILNSTENSYIKITVDNADKKIEIEGCQMTACSVVCG